VPVLSREYSNGMVEGMASAPASVEAKSPSCNIIVFGWVKERARRCGIFSPLGWGIMPLTKADAIRSKGARSESS
jgi:hypothetical protein